MKILHLLSQRPDSTGSGIYLQAILREASRAGHHNYLLAAIDENPALSLDRVIDERDRCLIDFRRSADGRASIIGMSDVMPYPSRRFRDLGGAALAAYLERFEQQLRICVEQWQPELIHSHHLWLLTSLARRLFPELPMVASCHGSELRQFEQCPHLRDQVLSGCRRLRTILALSLEQREGIAEGYGIPRERIRVTGAGFDPGLFFPGDTPAPPTTMIYGGKISRAKGLPWLLQSLDGLKDLDFRLHLAGSGSGPEFRSCLADAERFGSRILFHGAVSQSRLAELMRASGVFILPSLHEGLPLAVLEALACGCRVVATELPGTREIMAITRSSDLHLVPVPELTDLDATLLADEKRFIEDLRSAIRNAVNTAAPRPGPETYAHFSWAAVYSRIEQVWKELAAA